MLLSNPTIKRETAKAMLIQFDVEIEDTLIDLEEWMPKSQIKSISSQFVEITEWIAEQKEIVQKATALYTDFANA